MATHWGRYRIRSSRRRGWDYSAPAWYFVTICVRDRQPCLARVTDGRVELTAAGEVVADRWQAIAQIRPDVVLGEWVILPEHLHALIRLSAPPPTNHAGPGIPPGLVSAWRPGTLGVIINHFKRAVTVELARRKIPWAGWQPRYHDRIVRDANALAAIGKYITMNPLRYRPGPTWGPHHAGPRRGPAEGE
jgi:REP element-mobilizing transposase RayT